MWSEYEKSTKIDEIKKVEPEPKINVANTIKNFILQKKFVTEKLL